MSAGLIYVLYGGDRFTRDEQVRGLKRRMLNEAFGEYNLAELSGKEVGIGDVRAVADALPFMGSRRLIVVEGLLGRLAGSTRANPRRGRGPRTKSGSTGGDQSGLDAFLDYLGDVPDTTALVLVEDQIDPAIIAARIPAGRAHIRAYQRPRPAELSKWIERRAKHHGGALEAAAARQLSLLAPDDLGLLDNEIRKLVTYADGRTVTTDDVALLSSSPDVAVFGLVDAVAELRRGPALNHLRDLLGRGERPEGIVPQVAGALRRLLQARELLDQGLPRPVVQQRLGLHPFLAEKTERQARGWSIEQLEAAFRLLLATDRAIKTGEAEPEMALELFIADLPRQ
jgi:DNA polymerase-3 subunit delta